MSQQGRFLNGLGARSLRLVPMVALLSAPSVALAAEVDTDLDGVDDASDVFPCDWRRAAVTFVPAEGELSTLMFEDNWPARGDLDFNDAVLLHNVAVFHAPGGGVSGLRLTIVPRAIGASIESGVGLRLPIPAGSVASIVRTVGEQAPTTLTVLADETDMVVPVATRLRDLFAGAQGFLNTDPTRPTFGDGARVVVDIEFVRPVTLSFATDPFDLYFFRTDDPRHQIHRPTFGGTDTMRDNLFGTLDDGSTAARSFVDRDGLPFVLSVPLQSVWPRERERVEGLWPDIVDFAATGGEASADFYTRPDLSKAFSAPTSAAIGSVEYAACVAATCTDGARNGRESDVDCGGDCAPCGVGSACRAHADCTTEVCAQAACVASDTRTCSVTNGSGVQPRGGAGWAACVATACEANYHVEAGACVPDARACAVEGGRGTQTWAGGGFGPCVAESCDAAYRLVSGQCIARVYAWRAGAFGACAGGTATPSYGAWGACEGGAGAWGYGAWGACSAAAVCSGSGSQSRSAACSPTADSGTQSRSASCAWIGGSGVATRALTCVDDEGQTVDDVACTAPRPAATTSCTPTEVPTSCGAPLTTQACTPTGSAVCGEALTTQSCPSPAGTRSCTVPNGVGEEACASGGTSWGACTLVACNPTNHLENGACVSDTRACVSGSGSGSGLQTWTQASGWGTCVLTSCGLGDVLSGGVCVPPHGQVAYTTAGTYAWTVPVGVTSVSVVAVGGGGSGNTTRAAGGASSFGGTIVVANGGGIGGTGGGSGTYTRTGGVGGTVGAGTGFPGGAGGLLSVAFNGYGNSGGGGGAGGYTAAGANGANGANGGNVGEFRSGGAGGGVGLFGGTSGGAGGVGGGAAGNGTGGAGGSGGAAGGNAGGVGGAFGGGGGGAPSTASGVQNIAPGGGGALAYANWVAVTPGSTVNVVVGAGGGNGGRGAVRIIWGPSREFPGTSVGDVTSIP